MAAGDRPRFGPILASPFDMVAPRLLLIYATEEGHTHSIAEYIGLAAMERGFAVDMYPIERVPEGVFADAHRAVILGSSVHVGRHDPRLVTFARQHAKDLALRTCGFFSVSLSAASPDPKRRDEAHGYVRDFLDATGLRPELRAEFAGALRYTEYGSLKRFLLRQIAKSSGLATDTSRDHVYTSWRAVDAFTRAVLERAGVEQAA